MMQSLRNIFQLGIKELRGLVRDPLMVVLIVYCFTVNVYVSAKSQPDSISDAAIAIVDLDHSPLSKRITDAFLPPMFAHPVQISQHEIDDVLDRGQYTFVVVFQPNFQEKVLANNDPEVQLNVDATRMSQAFTGNGYIQQIILKEVNDFVNRHQDSGPVYTADALIRNRFNPNIIRAWDGGVTGLVNSVTMLALILTGAALIRERERGTLEHLLVMPVTPFEIMVSKVWSMSLVVFLATGVSLWLVIRDWLQVPMAGASWLFMLGVALNLFTVTSMGILLACFARDMPQLGILMILVLLPMQILSGGSTPQDCMPVAIQYVMQLAPTTHMVQIGKAIIFRGAGLPTVWPILAKMTVLGGIYFLVALRRFRRTVAA